MHFDNIIAGTLLENATEEEALEYARNICEYETLDREEIAYARYIDTVNGIEVYYDYGADYYFFVEADNG